MLFRQEQNLTVLTKLLLIHWEGGKLSEPEGQIMTVNKLSFLNWLFESCRKGVGYLTYCSTPAG